jgi:hypothetical protein
METNPVSATLETLRHAPMATILPHAIASEERGLRCFPLKGSAPQRTAALLRRRNGYRGAAAMAFTAMAEVWCVNNPGRREVSVNLLARVRSRRHSVRRCRMYALLREQARSQRAEKS